MFYPSRRFFSSLLGHRGSPNCTQAALISELAPWAPGLCGWVFQAQQLELSKFYRYPHLLHFAGLGDLLHQLVAFDAERAAEVSSRMRDFNAELLADDSAFWSTAISALACGRRISGLPVVAPWLRGLPADPHCNFGLRSPADERGLSACCAAWCGRCANCTGMASSCCPEQILAQAPPCEGAAPPCVVGQPQGRSCAESPSGCPVEVLRFATHLDQHVSGALASTSAPD